jgi:hypothetical protein
MVGFLLMAFRSGHDLIPLSDGIGFLTETTFDHVPEEFDQAIGPATLLCMSNMNLLSLFKKCGNY